MNNTHLFGLRALQTASWRCFRVFVLYKWISCLHSLYIRINLFLIFGFGFLVLEKQTDKKETQTNNHQSEALI